MRWMYVLLFLLSFYTPAPAIDCQSVSLDLKLPLKLKTRGKPSRARWEQVDKVMTSLHQRLKGEGCEFTFDQIFKSKKTELYFPLTNNVLRTVPEASLKGLSVFNQAGELLGRYENRVTYERSGGLYAKNSYTLYYFQFMDQRREIQSSGHRLLLDDFLVKWGDLAKKISLSTQ